MTRRSVQVLAAIVAGLVLLLAVLRLDDPGDAASYDRLLLPGFETAANELTALGVLLPGDGGRVSIYREDDRWRVRERDGYPADLGALRQLIGAIAGARIIEEKTSNPENYDRLGVDDPAEGGSGTRIELTGPEFDYAIILGNSVRGSARYARIAGEAQSYLVDRDPEPPQAPGEWLKPDIVDLAAADVGEVVITHADGETITISKTEREQTDFVVADVPDGRELSYATVGNSVAAALAGLELEDVRTAIERPAETTAEFRSWDGLRITAEVTAEGDEQWVGFTAAAESDDDDAAERAAEINARVAGWQYRLPDHKAGQLTRRWEDLLRPGDSDD